VKDVELPPERRATLDKAVRLEWVTIAYFVSVVTAIYLTLGASQAMKAAWIEDLLGFVPPAAFLIATRIRYRRPNERFPYGYHRSISIGFLCAALALLVMGLYVVYDSAMKLIMFEHPSIGVVQPFGDPIWLGWLMIAALAWGLVPPLLLGRAKLPLARDLHDKILYADAEMNRADWLTAGAAILGILGIRFGIWWGDAIAAIFIGLDIVWDGVKTTKQAVSSLMDARPESVEGDRAEGVPTRIENELRSLSWVKDVRVRMREEGHVFYGDAIVVVDDETNLASKIEHATERIMALDWRIYDFLISPSGSVEEAEKLHDAPEDEGTSSPTTS
jgi:cation diffusion facilitator family transporter